ncbi:MAG: hypothetical protein AAFQ42_06670 [Pseudomonadota bacterium]
MRITAGSVAAIFVAFGLSACANLPAGSGVSTSTLMPVPQSTSPRATRKTRRANLSSCRKVRRELRRLEAKRQVASPAYDRAIARYVDLRCDGAA